MLETKTWYKCDRTIVNFVVFMEVPKSNISLSLFFVKVIHTIKSIRDVGLHGRSVVCGREAGNS